MAVLTTNSGTSALGVLAAPFVAVFDMLTSLSEAQALSKEANILLGLSDEELAKRGFTRESAARHLAEKFSHL